MNRRDFLIQSTLSASLASLLPSTSLWGMTAPGYSGPLFVMVQANGGWDVTSVCDPKMNVPNELEINHWARTDETRQVGNIRYAPFGWNEAFFEKYYRDMLVINGIDARTNSHDTGVVHNWSGRLAAGYPALPALLSAVYAPDMPISWINNGGYPETANLIRYTRMDDPFRIKNIAYPNEAVWDSDGNRWITDVEWNDLQNAQRLRLNDLRNSTNLLPWQRMHRDIHYSARENADSLQVFADSIPSVDQLEPAEIDGEWMPLRRQAQLTLLAFQSGVAMAADIVHNVFDTHADHDALHEPGLIHVMDSVDYLWEYAETLGLADRLTVLIASDFSRTPYYNEGNGKDHWPIGSAIIMQKNAPWGNRVIGVTDEGHNAIKINPLSLQPDVNGTLIYPRHVMTAFRQLAGIDTHPIAQRFPLEDLDNFDWFNPAIHTPQGSGDPRNTIR